MTYTPSPEEIEELYSIVRANGDPNNLPSSKSGEAEARQGFRRWFAEHTRQAQENAWGDNHNYPYETMRDNPYLKAE